MLQNRKSLLLVGAISVFVLVLVVAGLYSLRNTKGSEPSHYDAFLGMTVTGKAGQPPQKGSVLDFSIYDSDKLKAYFSNDDVRLITRSIGGYAIGSIDNNMYRAKLTNDKIVAPGDGSITFKVIFDTPNSGVYVVRIVQLTQNPYFSSFTITDPKGVVHSLYSQNAHD